MEMLIAVTLVALMAVGLWSVFSISLRSWSRGTQFIDKNQRHRTTLDMVRKQIASAYGLYGQIEEESSTNQGLIFFGTSDFLRFLSLNSLQLQESPGLTLVSYEVVQNSPGEFILMQRETRYLNQKIEEGLFTDQSAVTTIFENLASCTFEYLDPGGTTNPPRWVTEWDGKQSGRLPAAVSITLVARDPRGNNLSRHMVVSIPAKPQSLRPNILTPFGARVSVVQ